MCLRAVFALSETPDEVPTTHIVNHKSVTPVPGYLIYVLASIGTRHTFGTHTYTQERHS